MEATLWHPRAPVMFIKVQLENQGSTRNSEARRPTTEAARSGVGLPFENQMAAEGNPIPSGGP